MVDTVSHQNDVLLKSISEMIDNYKNDDSFDIIDFYRCLRSLKGDIKDCIGDELNAAFMLEYNCVYYEQLYGDGQYTDHVVGDCISVLAKIIDELTVKDVLTTIINELPLKD